MRGIVIKNTGSSYQVKLDDGTLVDARIKGKFRLQGIRLTNPVVVGDIVQLDGESIDVIEPRKNYIIRKASNLSKEAHILASNIDQALLLVTIKQPTTATEFIDRFLVTGVAYGVPVILVLNKIDTLDEYELQYLDNLIYLYNSLGYKCIKTSVINNIGVDELKDCLKSKTTLLSGNSGVGKSSLLNALNPDLQLKTANVSHSHNKGMHTTTFSQMFDIDGAYIIDTPGVKGFGVVDMEAAEISHYFPEIFKISKNCRFGNCTHTNEPGCAVLKALDEHYISQSRYNSYISLLEDLQSGKYR